VEWNLDVNGSYGGQDYFRVCGIFFCANLGIPVEMAVEVLNSI
jgi:hypothetical protein